MPMSFGFLVHGLGLLVGLLPRLAHVYTFVVTQAQKARKSSNLLFLLFLFFAFVVNVKNITNKIHIHRNVNYN